MTKHTNIIKASRESLLKTIKYYRGLQDKADAEKTGGFPSSEAHQYYKNGMDAVIAIIKEVSA